MSAHKVNRDLAKAGKLGIQTKCYDSSGNITFDSGATVPGSVAGYAIGALFVQNDATTPGAGMYVNTGTATTANFVPNASVAAMMMLGVPILGTYFGAGGGGMYVWTAPVATVITGISYINSVPGAAGNLLVTKLTGTATPDTAHNGTTSYRLITNNTNAGFDAASAAGTVVTGALTGISVDLQFAPGNRIGVRSSAAQGASGMMGVLTVMGYPL